MSGLNAQLAALNSVGQSVWYDNLSREVLDNGELQSLIASGVSGLTSNPTIFKQAIADTSDYDEELRRLAAEGYGTEQICEELMLQDVGRAADLLRPVYDRTGGADGFASIEVSPLLAHNTAGTLDAAKNLFIRLGRPNIMIKIPATTEGLPAIQGALEAGVNVNITLIFSNHFYRKVMEAYLQALEARRARDEGIDQIASVASFFVSRVDAICEKEMKGLLSSNKISQADFDCVFGKIGIANSRLAYRSFKDAFGGDRFSALASYGARVQRPLWASTGTKNPAFSEVLYVEQLAGPDTVNTTPPKTLKALMKSADITNRIQNELAEAEQVLAKLDQLGVPFEQLLDQLQVQGVKSFSDSYHELLESIESKQKKLS